MTKILILGGGFGGIRCALDLEKKSGNDVTVTLIDKNSYHLFLPALYEAASAFKGSLKNDPFALRLKKTICIPFYDIFKNKKVNFVQAEVCEVDLSAKKVKTKGGNVFCYDYLVVAIGSQAEDFGIPGVSEYAYQFKSLEDALIINEKLENLVKDVVSNKKVSPVNVLVVGAGFNGVELAAELSCRAKNISEKFNAKNKCSKIVLVESGPRFLPMISDSERAIILQRLTKLGVVLMENSPVEKVETGFVKIKNGQVLIGDMIIWTAGVRANVFLKSVAGLSLTDKGKIVVGQNLQAKDWKNVFAVGDNQGFVDNKTQKPVPLFAYMAIEQGKVVANNILKNLKGLKNQHYKPEYGVWVVPVGGKFALVHLWKGLRFSGLVGWLIRELVDLKYLVSILSFKGGLLFFWREISLFNKKD